MVSDANTHPGQHLSEQLARKEPSVLTAAAGIATAHYTSVRWSEGSSVSFPAAGAGSIGGDGTELLPRRRWLRIKSDRAEFSRSVNMHESVPVSSTIDCC